MEVVSLLNRLIEYLGRNLVFSINQKLFRSQYIELFVEISHQKCGSEIFKPDFPFVFICDVLTQSVSPNFIVLDFLNPLNLGSIDLIIGDGKEEGLLVREELNLFRR